MRFHQIIIGGVLLLLGTNALSAAQPLDMIYFGDERSEKDHVFQTTASQVKTGGLGQSCRILLPLDPPSHYGGNVRFVLKVDPEKTNYFTLKIWGSDVSGEEETRLLLLAEGKQVGIRHLGDVDCLDVMSEKPRFPNRFTYITTILPESLTRGKSSITLEIRGLGRIWGYGETWERFQKPLTQPTRGVYAAYTHIETYFIPPPHETQGDPPNSVQFNELDDPNDQKVLAEIKERVCQEIERILSSKSLDQMRVQFLAHAYFISWTPAYENPRVIDQIVQSLDQIYRDYESNPGRARSDPATWNADWYGFGPAGDALRLLGDKMQDKLDEILPGGTLRRREAYAKMLLGSRDWHRANRRAYTNQSMIKDLNIYLANRGIQVVAPEQAMPEDQAKRYLHEAVGLIPWTGNDLPNGQSQKPLGENYRLLTDRGLTKELGYVGTYGEVSTELLTTIYNATRRTLHEEGDSKIKQQLIRVAQTRSIFRYPLINQENQVRPVLETVIDWRGNQYPGPVIYAQRAARDSGPFEAAVATQDPALVAYAQQMIRDGQFAPSMREVLQEKSFRTTFSLLNTPDSYQKIRSLPESHAKFPMFPGSPDFVFTDEENGVVALKNGTDILYASIYWRARFGINFLARVHLLTPIVERQATVRQQCLYDDSGLVYVRDNRIMEHQTTRHEKNSDLEQALAGEKLPIAKIPPGLSFKPGQESVFAGKCTFYLLHYGPYTIAMNTTPDRSFDFVAPVSGKNLRTGEHISSNSTLKVAPRSTVVLYAE